MWIEAINEDVYYIMKGQEGNNIERGYSILSTSSVVICGIVQNCEKRLVRNIPRIERFRQCCRDSYVYIYENDSSDGTPRILNQWVTDSRKIFCSCEISQVESPREQLVSNVKPYPGYSIKRIERIAKCRNKVLDMANQRLSEQVDFVVVVDLDLLSIDVEGVIGAVGRSFDWDVITSNGVFPTKKGFRYYDAFALRELADSSPQTLKKMANAQVKFAGLKKGDLPIQVTCAFGGLAVYRGRDLLQKRYRANQNADPEVEAVCEHETMIYDLKVRKVYIDPNMRVDYDSYLSRFFKIIGIS